MERTRPPFRADHVGSLIRPSWLIEARRNCLAGKLPGSELQALEDRAIGEVVATEEELGLRSITDGEFRRQSYLLDFLRSIGVEMETGKSEDMFYHDDHGGKVPGSRTTVARKIAWTGSINVEPFKFLKSLTRQTAKVTIPAPTQIHLFAGRDGISKAIYPDIDAFWDDIVTAYQAELRALAAAGCVYVQIDETSMPKLADPEIQQAVAARGQNWRANLDKYAEVINRILAAAPPEMTVALHHCRGNQAGLWQAQAGYETVAELMFATVHAGAYLLEFDTPRAGDFNSLRFMPKNKIAMLGLVSTKSNRVETADELKHRIDEAGRYMDLDRLCLGPQCGFSCGFAGSPITYDNQLAKLRRIVEVARDVWNA